MRALLEGQENPSSCRPSKANIQYKTFQWGDIAANLLGATLFTYIAHLMSVRARRRSEIRELYQPLQASSYRDAQGRVHLFDRDVEAGEGGFSDDEAGGTRGGVWDDTVSEHELRLSGDNTAAAFALGDEDEEDEPPRKKSPALGLQLE